MHVLALNWPVSKPDSFCRPRELEWKVLFAGVRASPSRWVVVFGVRAIRSLDTTAVSCVPGAVCSLMDETSGLSEVLYCGR